MAVRGERMRILTIEKLEIQQNGKDVWVTARSPQHDSLILKTTTGAARLLSIGGEIKVDFMPTKQ